VHGRDQQQAYRIQRAENDAKRAAPNGCDITCCVAWKRRRTAAEGERGCAPAGQRAVAYLIDHRRDGRTPPVSTKSGWAGTICETGRARPFDGEFSPSKVDPNRHAESEPRSRPQWPSVLWLP